MIDNLPEKPKSFVTDLKDFNENEKSLYMSVSVKNINRLKDLQIENLWLIGANNKELTRILPWVNLNYLNLYQLLATDLTILETQKNPEAIILNWNTKAASLWNISKNLNLKILEITDFSKAEDLKQISLATQIDSLTFGGGHGKSVKIKSLQPLSNLNNLKYLGLRNLKVEDNTLHPLGQLKNLDVLGISNQFETKEYAWLATRLFKTKCRMFQAINKCNIVNANNELVWDTMVTGRRKPFLLSTKDQVKIDSFIKNFEKLKNELAE